MHRTLNMNVFCVIERVYLQLSAKMTATVIRWEITKTSINSLINQSINIHMSKRCHRWRINRTSVSVGERDELNCGIPTKCDTRLEVVHAHWFDWLTNKWLILQTHNLQYKLQRHTLDQDELMWLQRRLWVFSLVRSELIPGVVEYYSQHRDLTILARQNLTPLLHIERENYKNWTLVTFF